LTRTGRNWGRAGFCPEIFSNSFRAARIRSARAVNPRQKETFPCRSEGIHGRLESIHGRLEGIHGRLESIHGRLESIHGRLESLLSDRECSLFGKKLLHLSI